MKFRLAKLKVLFWVINSLLMIQNVNARTLSLSAALDNAFKNNPKTKANDLRLNALYEEVDAAYMRTMFPSFNASISKSFDERDDGVNLTNSQLSNTNLSLNWNIFRGFSDYYRNKNRKCNYERQIQLYNSSNTFIPNTKGQIASLVANFYIELSAAREGLLFNAYKVRTIEKVIPYAKREQDIQRLKNSLFYFQNIERTLYLNAEQLAFHSLQYEMSVDLDKNLDPIIETAAKLSVPESFESALEIGQIMSPEVISAKFNIECQDYNLKASKADIFGFNVDLSLRNSTTQSVLDGNKSSRSRQNSQSITASKNIDFGLRSSKRASEIRLASAELDLNAATIDLKTNLKRQYLNLTGLNNEFSGNYASFNKIVSDIDVQVKRIQDGNIELDSFQYLIELTNSLNSRWEGYISNLRQIINTKFQIQRLAGLLFEDVDAAMALEQSLRNEESNEEEIKKD